MHEFDHEEVAERVRAARPDILLVAFGCPKQEKWIYMNRHRLEVACAIGVGATIDFLAGKVSRAPDWVGKAGLEWIYRLLQEPRRLFKRYWRDFTFLCRQTLRERKLGAVHTIVDESNEPPAHRGKARVIRWSGRLTHNGSAMEPLAVDARHDPRPCRN